MLIFAIASFYSNQSEWRNLDLNCTIDIIVIPQGHKLQQRSKLIVTKYITICALELFSFGPEARTSPPYDSHISVVRSSRWRTLGFFSKIVRLSFSEGQIYNVYGLFQVFGVNLRRWRTVTLRFHPNNCANCIPRPCHDQAKVASLFWNVKAPVFTLQKRFFIKAWPCLSKSYSKQFQTFILMLTNQLIMSVPSALWSLSIYWFSCHGICVLSCWIRLRAF